MKVNIWITTDEGIDYCAENLDWSEVCAMIVDQHNQEELFNLLNNEVIKDYIKDVVNESNKT